MRKLLVIVPILGLLTAGCASLSAKDKGPVDRPALVVPPPPPRTIEPAVELPPEPVDDLPPVTGAPPPTAPPRSNRPREAPPKPAAEKPAEPKPAEPTVAEAPAPAPPPPSAQLRTPQTADTSGAAKAVRTTIDTAQGLLNTVNYNPLTNERKKAYNDAKKLLEEAEDALKKSDLERARAVAGKAETLAKELAGK